MINTTESNLPPGVTPEMVDEQMAEHIHCTNCETEIMSGDDELACVKCREPMCKLCHEYTITCETCLDIEYNE